jgi:micrococcal nuclease
MPSHGQEHIVVDVVLCSPACAPSVLRVWDGDSVRIGFGRNAERVRLANIDAPEIEGRCKVETDLALQSQFSLADLLSGSTVTLVRLGSDRHDRTLAALSVDGVDIGEILVSEGLARVWHGRRQPWC